MKQLIAILAFVMASQAQAQGVRYAQYSQMPQAPAKKRTMIYDERTNELVEVQPEVQTVPSQAPTAAANGSQNPIVILNSQNQRFQGVQGQTSIQEQPTTIVEDSPLRSSPADNMRKKRQDTEAQTEDGIVQALERARMEDEMRRRDRFNSAIGSGATETQTQTQIYAPSPVVVAAPVQQQQQQQQIVTQAPVVVAAPVKEEEEEKVDIRSEIRTALSDLNKKDEEPPARYYVSGLVGMSKYPDVVNVRGNVASGFTVGAVTPERVVAEGSFIYSSFEMEDLRNSTPYYPRIVDLRQYNFGAALKYQLLPGRFRPNIGAVANYVRRSFADQYYSTQYRTSDAFDLGFVAGADLQLTESFSLGFDFRYMTNIAYREHSDTPKSFVYPQASDKPVEKLDYYTGALTGKFTF